MCIEEVICGSACLPLPPGGLVADGEAFAAVFGVFEFIHQGDGVVLHRDAAFVLLVGDEVVFAEAVFGGALAGFEVRGGAEVGPVDGGLFQVIEDGDVGVDDGEVGRRQVAGGTQGDAGSDEEGACSTDDDETRASVFFRRPGRDFQ